MVVGASPLCNIMVMHFDTKNTIIVHQGDPNTKPGHIYFFHMLEEQRAFFQPQFHFR